MKRLPLMHEGRRDDGISSMVDMAFLLLIFFIVTTTILPRESDLPMEMPKDSEAHEVPATPVWVEIAADGSVFWGSGDAAMAVALAADRRELPELERMLLSATRSAGAKELPVMLKTSDEVSQQRFTDVLNCFAGSGIGQVAMVE